MWSRCGYTSRPDRDRDRRVEHRHGLSPSLSALSSSTVTDVVAKLSRTPMSDAQGLRIGRWATTGWGLAFIAPATIFRSDEGSIVVLALGVAGSTYGGLLGAFLFGIVSIAVDGVLSLRRQGVIRRQDVSADTDAL